MPCVSCISCISCKTAALMGTRSTRKSDSHRAPWTHANPPRASAGVHMTSPSVNRGLLLLRSACIHSQHLSLAYCLAFSFPFARFCYFRAAVAFLLATCCVTCVAYLGISYEHAVNFGSCSGCPPEFTQAPPWSQIVREVEARESSLDEVLHTDYVFSGRRIFEQQQHF